MRTLISILAILSFALLFCFQTASAAVIGDMARTREDLYSVLDDTLHEHLEEAADDDVIRVTIELMDGIDLDRVELNAISRANISAAEEASLNVAAFSSDKAESESVQLAALEVYDRISKERNTLLKEYYSVKNEAFITSTCLKDAEIGSVGLFTLP
ncbi:MAG: hypothetical protein K2N56_10440 [Oscillospiraceae bacterium]|nr:hypothetical protein [Oscillospiraceae bacterium]